MAAEKNAPLIVHGDQSILLDIHTPLADQARKAIAPFAELEKSPEHIHTYRLSHLSLWNAAAAGYDTPHILSLLSEYSRYPLPSDMERKVAEIMGRYGMLSLVESNAQGAANKIAWGQDNEIPLLLLVHDTFLFRMLRDNSGLHNLISPAPAGSAGRGADSSKAFFVSPKYRGKIKQELIRIGYPIQDLIPLRDGLPCAMKLTSAVRQRDYQIQAVDAFLGNLEKGTGYGTIVLPCGSGKTVVGIEVMRRLETSTLILCPNITALHQWKTELLNKTTLSEDDIGEYNARTKDVRKVTISTYQILTWRSRKGGEFPHLSLMTGHQWGLIIYDEVHLLPAPVFSMTAEVQAVRRLGLTATLVREDGREREVFSLVGPKRFDVPWKDLEGRGWISRAICKEIRVELPESLQTDYALAEKRKQYRIASENPRKLDILTYLIRHHAQDQILVIGQYISQLHTVQKHLNAPIITGATSDTNRTALYDRFRNGDIRILIVSKVANFAIDLPDASVAIQISGTFGSRQEEAQRLGRILRPKKHAAYFYTLISRYTSEEDFGINRQKFLAEQGYSYILELWEDEKT
ncbi:MAG: DNA repair helicase XPB [Salinispira sp.]